MNCQQWRIRCSPDTRGESRYTLLACLLLAATAAGLSCAAPAAAADAPGWGECLRLFPRDDARRLQCYDDLAKKASGAPAAAPVDNGGPAQSTTAPDVASGASGAASGAPGAASGAPGASGVAPAALAADASEPPAAAPGRFLAESWMLDPARPSVPLANVRAYRPMYVLFARWTNGANQLPSSPSPDHQTASPRGWDSVEAKFQLSFKSELTGASWREPMLGFTGYRLWAAYTQQSYWQVYNERLSRPFRDTDYEPEIILTLPRVGASDEGDSRREPPMWRMLNIGLVHQSNGRADPESRSWNRLYVQSGWERGSLAMLGRLWWRIPESASADDNPDITSYVGRGDVLVRWTANDWVVSTLLRHTLKLNPSRGFVELNVFTPHLDILGRTRAYLQFTSGYGDSLIDYNFKQNTIGIGVSFGDSW